MYGTELGFPSTVLGTTASHKYHTRNIISPVVRLISMKMGFRDIFLFISGNNTDYGSSTFLGK